MTIGLDEVNKRIIHALMEDVRNRFAPMIASEVGVSPATVRNRIAQPEEPGIIRGSHTTVDFEQGDGLLACVYICTAPVSLAVVGWFESTLLSHHHERRVVSFERLRPTASETEGLAPFTAKRTSLLRCGLESVDDTTELLLASTAAEQSLKQRAM